MLRLILLLPLIAVLVIFALSNRAPVQIQFWPFDLAWEAPLSLVVLLASALSFLLGAVVAWGAALPARRRARSLEKAGRLLEIELDTLKAEAAARREGLT
ncbi:lipopolysaccharide assembly protein LapA domain-containing protein [Humitalea sp. 24SJ18S-53]|uniref:lipopolysaccharide assembly protein LapA domain-containing protein n=1 Tax=Humitalea sp. 24SJ18S-53 TaxID=3422307 RepID=UPI003D675E6D